MACFNVHVYCNDARTLAAQDEIESSRFCLLYCHGFCCFQKQLSFALSKRHGGGNTIEWSETERDELEGKGVKEMKEEQEKEEIKIEKLQLR